MNTRLYKALSLIPGLGLIVGKKCNFFYLKGSQFMEDFMKTEEYKAIMAWLKEHPNQVIGPQKANKIIEEVGRKQN